MIVATAGARDGGQWDKEGADPVNRRALRTPCGAAAATAAQRLAAQLW
jgi:hypothetical protein